MKLTPLDVRKQEFKRSFRGYDTVEVRMFLDLAAEEMEALVRERADLSDTVQRQGKELAEYKEKERLLQSALMAAERVAEETRENARREGDLLIKDAELAAERLTGEARKDVVGIRSEIEDLRMRRSVFLAKMRSFLQSQLDILEGELEDGRSESVEQHAQHDM